MWPWYAPCLQPLACATSAARSAGPAAAVWLALAAGRRFRPIFVRARPFRRHALIACASSLELWGACRRVRAPPVRGGCMRRNALLGVPVLVLLTAMLAPSDAGAAFTQCPPVGSDTSCQYLVTVTDAGPSVAGDLTQGPYEASDDSLIGVQNSSSKAIAALPLAATGTSLFGFEADGICNPGMAPLPPGCVPVPG